MSKYRIETQWAGNRPFARLMNQKDEVLCVSMGDTESEARTTLMNEASTMILDPDLSDKKLDQLVASVDDMDLPPDTGLGDLVEAYFRARQEALGLVPNADTAEALERAEKIKKVMNSVKVGVKDDLFCG